MATQNLSNNVQVTNQGGDILDAACSDLVGIRTKVDDAVNTLVGQHMVSLSGRAYGSAIKQWLDDFDIIKTKLHEMSQLLSHTAKAMSNNEQTNAEMPSTIVNHLRGNKGI